MTAANHCLHAVLQLVRQHGLPRWTIARLEKFLYHGVVSSQDICGYFWNIAQSGENEWAMNAYERLLERSTVLEQAAESDARRKDSQIKSRLDGLPIAVKANFAVASLPLTAGSRILYSPSESPTMPAVGYTADVVSHLVEDCGAILLGTTSMDEFGMGSLGTNVVANYSSVCNEKATKATRNPLPLLQRSLHHDKLWTDEQLLNLIRLDGDAIMELHAYLLEKATRGENNNNNNNNNNDPLLYSTGGSSSGSAATVAHGSALMALGSDTGGSIRLPAAWCGVVGLKPSYGLLSRHGLVAYASSLDTVGLLAPTTHCVSVMLDSILTAAAVAATEIGHNEQYCLDSTYTAPSDKFLREVRNVANNDTQSNKLSGNKNVDANLLAGLRVGIPAAFVLEECPPAVRQAWSKAASILEDHGATLQSVPEIETQVLQKALATYYVLGCAEASSNLARYDGFRYGAAIPMIKDHNISQQVDTANTDELFSSFLEEQYATTRSTYFGREVLRRILCGTFVLSSDRFHSYYEAATKWRAMITQQLRQALLPQANDVLLIPTTMSHPPPRTDQAIDTTALLVNDILTVPMSLAGLPALSIPAQIENHNNDNNNDPAPTCFRSGLQIVAACHGEATILRIAAVLEEK